MKVVIREWLKSPKSCVLLVLSIIAQVIYTVLNARLLLMISGALSDPDHMQNHLIMIGIICITQIVLKTIREKLRTSARHYSFTFFHDRYANAILDADVDMYTRLSCAHIHSVGEFCNRLTRVGMSVGQFLLDIISMIVTLCYMYQLAGRTTVISVVIVYIIGAMITKYLFTVYSKIDDEADRLRGLRNQEYENVIQGFIEVRSFYKTEWHRERYRGLNHKTYAMFLKRANVSVLISALFELIDTTGLVIMLLYSAKGIIEGTINAAQGMTLVSYVFRLLEPMSNVMNFIDELSQNLSMSDKYAEIINYANKERVDGVVELANFDDVVNIKNVSFSYGNSKDVLRNINMTIKKGEKVGICGISGGGKSTIFKLLNRFYSPTSGEILIDGFNIADISESSYRRIIGSVHQENYIFPGTIRENIAYGAMSYTEEEFLSACKKANVYEFVMEQDMKFDTVVGPKGLKLSGGQKQRIALARLLLMDPEIILLDEATSALDNESEYLIQNAIDNLGGKTVVSIAHRLSTIKNFDHIYVIGSHGVVGHGTHDELMKTCKEYARMVELSEKRRV